jgi:hypothetical protein
MTNEVRGANTDSEAARRQAADTRIAADPYGDTFEHFARFCRSYTGSSFLDSGSAYGYTYNRPMRAKDAPAMRAERETYRGATHEEWFERMRDLSDLDEHEPVRLSDLGKNSPCEMTAHVSLEHWMAHHLQASDETRWLNRLYAWWESNLNDSARSFDTEEFVKWAQAARAASLHDTEPRGAEDETHPESEQRAARVKLVRSVTDHDARRDLLALLKEEDDGGFFDVLLEYDEEIEHVASGNTYNDDNDLSQDLQWHAFGPERRDFYGVKLLAVQPHCGCDARGGYPQPRWYSVDGSDGDWTSWRTTFWIGEGNDMESEHLRFVPLDWWRTQRPDVDTLTLPGVAKAPNPDDWDESCATIVADENGEKWILIYIGGHRWSNDPVGSCNIRYSCGELS